MTIALFGHFLLGLRPHWGLSQCDPSPLQVDHLSLQFHSAFLLLLLLHSLVLLFGEYALSLFELVLEHLLLQILFDAGVLLLFDEAEGDLVFFGESLESVLGAHYAEVH